MSYVLLVIEQKQEIESEKNYMYIVLLILMYVHSSVLTYKTITQTDKYTHS